jgi:hypothetical protein
MKIVKIQSVVDVVTADLRQKIIRGVLTSGQRIRKGNRTRVQYEQTPVRESLRFLSLKGLITIRPRGAFVSEITQRTSGKFIQSTLPSLTWPLNSPLKKHQQRISENWSISSQRWKKALIKNLRTSRNIIIPQHVSREYSADCRKQPVDEDLHQFKQSDTQIQ